MVAQFQTPLVRLADTDREAFENKYGMNHGEKIPTHNTQEDTCHEFIKNLQKTTAVCADKNIEN